MKKLKKFDYVIIFLVLAVLAAGVYVFAAKKRVSKLPIEAVAKINFEVALKSVTLTNHDDLFKAGEKTFLTIRNVPYKALTVVDVKSERKKMVLPYVGADRKMVVADDVTSPNQYDIVVKVEDTAKITDDGPVIGGNKIKIGIPIVLEGKDYKLNGVVSSLAVSKD